MSPPRWHLGIRVAAKRGRWVNRWLIDPCPDLALPFEVGTRAFHSNRSGESS